MTREQLVARALAKNAEILVENGPRLSYDYEIVVLGRDSKRRRVLLGGLGASGNGVQWSDEDQYTHLYIGYEGAPEREEN